MPTDPEAQSERSSLVSGTDTGKQAPQLSSGAISGAIGGAFCYLAVVGAIGGANLNRFFDLNDPYIYFTHDLFFFFFHSPCFA